MIGVLPRLKFAGLAIVFPLLVVVGLLAAAPASAALPAVVVPCNTPALILAISAAVTIGGAQTLSLSPGCIYTLTAANNGSNVDTNGLPLITNTVRLTIDGGGATIVRDPGAPRFRLFEVGAGASLALANLTLAGGHTPDGVSASSGKGGFGGAILDSGGVLTVTNSTIRGNTTGAGGNCCSAVVDGIGGFGGGIDADGGILTVISSTLAGNSTGAGGSNGGGNGGPGGGLAGQQATVNVVDSTLSGNFTGPANLSGTIQLGGLGGGIYIFRGMLNVADSTIAENTTGTNFSSLGQSLGGGAGMLVDESTLTMTNSTLASNTTGSDGLGGAYVVVATNFVLKNTLVVSNSRDSCLGAVSAGSTHNMADSSTCVLSFTQRPTPQINVGPLQNNGGPTPTLALLFPSTAIDAGDLASCPAADQRGQPRPHGLGCDIGAYEFQSALTYLFLPLVRR